METTEEWAELYWDSAPYLCFDFETTGFSGEDRICEVGVVLASRGTVIRKYHSLIDPQTEIDGNATMVHGITDEDVRGKPTWDEAFPEFREFFYLDAPWVAHNLSFDARMMSYSWEASGWPRGVPTLCTMHYSKNVHPTTKRRRVHKLPMLANYFGIPYDTEELHNALYDAEILAKIVPKLMGRRLIGHSMTRFSHEWRK